MIRNLRHRVSLTLCVFMLLASQVAAARSAPGAANAQPIGLAATIQPAALNAAPIAVDDAELVPDGSPTLVINVLANDSDPDGDPLTVTTVATPDHGAATTNGTTVTYTPNAGFSGADTFDYTISDGVLTDTAIVIANV